MKNLFKSVALELYMNRATVTEILRSMHFKPHDKTVKLFHISFKEDLEGIWNPRNPQAGEQYYTDKDLHKIKSITAEPDLPRISTSTTLTGCIGGIYANISHYFEDEKYNYPHLDFYVYSPVFDNKKVIRVLTPKDLTDNEMVYDAHITHEHAILDPVYMKLVSKIRVYNCKDLPLMDFYPYNDHRYEILKQQGIPVGVVIKTIHKYNL